jgi:hypothetical protein
VPGSSEEGGQVEQNGNWSDRLKIGNPKFARLETNHSGPAVTLESCPQAAKQRHPIISIDEGRQIDSNEEQLLNAESSRIDSRQSCSNETFDRLLQRQKHPLEIRSSEDGIAID